METWRKRVNLERVCVFVRWKDDWGNWRIFRWVKRRNGERGEIRSECV